MKKIFLLWVLFAATSIQNNFAQDITIAQLLKQYYQMKDALVAGNSADASIAANNFIKSANSADNKIISEGNVQALVKDASKIAEVKDLGKQRQAFSSLSDNMITLAKSTKLTDQPIYQQYCPMKKASWLSSEKTIKNPYYGSSMLTCGKVTETIQ